MKIENIKFVQRDEGAIPDTITATMTLEEAVWIAEKAGKENGTYSPSWDIYEALTGDVFNRYWDDGDDGAMKTIRKYKDSHRMNETTNPIHITKSKKHYTSEHLLNEKIEYDMTNEQLHILEHTINRAANGCYCGNSSAMQSLVAKGLMEFIGFKPHVPDKYFKITDQGRAVLNMHEENQNEKQ